MMETPRKFYYVSAIDGTKRYLVAGPFPTHDGALDSVDKVKAYARKGDGRAHFMAWGTAGSDTEHHAPMTAANVAALTG